DDCPCISCEYDRSNLGCTHPHKCASQAKRLLDNLEPKWDPRQGMNNDALDLDEEDKIRNGANTALELPMVFDPNCETGSNLSDVFRIFAGTRTE
ncbi:hypothetical protein ARMSODRAFT_849159, partial [Armillaria solidipes]